MEAPTQAKSSPWLLIVGAVVVALVLFFVFSDGWGDDTSDNGPFGVIVAPTNGLSIVEIKAEGGKFLPNEITVKRPDPVMIMFTAVDDKYDIGFEDPKIGFDVIAEVGAVQRFGFETSDKTPGFYTFHCIEFCPKGEMTGTLKIE